MELFSARRVEGAWEEKVMLVEGQETQLQEPD